MISIRDFWSRAKPRRHGSCRQEGRSLNARATDTPIAIAFDDQGCGDPAPLCLPVWFVDRSAFRFSMLEVPEDVANATQLFLEQRGEEDSGQRQCDVSEPSGQVASCNRVPDQVCRSLQLKLLHNPALQAGCIRP